MIATSTCWRRRDGLRIKRDGEGLSSAEALELARAEAAFKAHTAMMLEAQSQLVESVRQIADRYRSYASIFVGGVPGSPPTWSVSSPATWSFRLGHPGDHAAHPGADLPPRALV